MSSADSPELGPTGMKIFVGVLLTIVVFIVYVVAAGIRQNHATGSLHHTIYSFYAPDYSATLGGPVSGKSYPLQIGKPIDGDSGSTSSTVSAGLFSSSSATVISIQPDESIKVGFTSSTGKRYIFVVSHNQVDYPPIKPGQKPSATFVLKTTLIDTHKDNFVRSGSHNFWLFENFHYHAEAPKIQETNAWSEVQAQGLTKFVEVNVAFVHLRLTQAQWLQLLQG